MFNGSEENLSFVSSETNPIMSVPKSELFLLKKQLRSI